MLRVKLRHLDGFNAARRRVADAYREGLASLGLALPASFPDRRHVYGQFTVRVGDRDYVRDRLGRQGIGTAVYYPIPLHRQPVCAGGDTEVALPNSDSAADECLSLPMFPGMTDTQASEVVSVLASVLGRQVANG
jgi:dTDP-4-amino-4,6-dideoxygalactose transaminase